jgi:hypothetical protein
LTTQVSVGQAACNALAQWLDATLQDDITVYDRWPEANPSLAPKAISVIRAGRRQRLDVVTGAQAESQKAISPAPNAQVNLRLGSFIQPIQLDVWAQSDVERDDMISQLDAALSAGTQQTLGTAALSSDDPVRDGILLQLGDGYSGNIEVLLDEPDVSDDADSVQRSEYRAMYAGEIRGSYSIQVTVPTIKQAIPTIQKAP